MTETRPDILGAIKGRLTDFLTRRPETKGQKPTAPAAPLLRGDTPRPLQETRDSGQKTK